MIVKAEASRPSQQAQAMKPRMTVTPLEELRRRRGVNPPVWRQSSAPPRPVAFIGSPDSLPVEPNRAVLPWVLVAAMFCAACCAGTGWWLSARNDSGAPRDQRIATDARPLANGNEVHAAGLH